MDLKNYVFVQCLCTHSDRNSGAESVQIYYSFRQHFLLARGIPQNLGVQGYAVLVFPYILDKISWCDN